MNTIAVKTIEVNCAFCDKPCQVSKIETGEGLHKSHHIEIKHEIPLCTGYINLEQGDFMRACQQKIIDNRRMNQS